MKRFMFSLVIVLSCASLLPFTVLAQDAIKSDFLRR